MELSKTISVLPLIQPTLLYILAAMLLAMLVWSFVRGRAGLVRCLLVAAFIIYVVNPVAIERQETPAGDVALVLIDDSESQNVSGRSEISEKVESALMEKLSSLPGLSVLKKSLSETTGDQDKQSRLNEAVSKAIAEVPAERNAGVIVITDGRIHDMPEDGSSGIESKKPVHFLVTKKPHEGDIWLEVKSQQRFGFVGDSAKAELVLHADGEASKSPRKITITNDNGDTESLTATPGEPFEVSINLARRGKNAVRVDVARESEELSKTNNSVLLISSATRDRMKVLLVTGKIYEGQRVWRNFLKSDPSVDLVHFNILRNISDRETASSSELSLIPFPVDELFGSKLPGFDLVIIDQFPESPAISEYYLSNIANYVKQGGSLLFITGAMSDNSAILESPDFAEILPVILSGASTEGAFLPAVTASGSEFPLTKPLAEMAAKGRKWGRWYRIADSAPRTGSSILMSGASMKPLLVVKETEKGRAAVFTSDQVWLWSKKHDGGGPYNVLIPNIIHWLLHEPELEEKVVEAKVAGEELKIKISGAGRKENANPSVIVTMPDGVSTMPEMKENEKGNLTGSLSATQKGVYTVAAGENIVFISTAASDSKEYSGITASTESAAKIAGSTGGAAVTTSGDVPEVRMVRPSATAEGSGWIGLVSNNQKVVSGVKTEPLIPAHLFLIVLLAALLGAWWRESGRR